MALSNGMNLRDLDDHMRECVDNIRYLTSEVAEKNHEISSTEETLSDLRAEGLVTPELEDKFERAKQHYLNERAELEQKREAIKEAAVQELNEAKANLEKAVDGVSSTNGSQAAEILSTLRERAVEIGDWEKELQDAMDGSDSPPEPREKTKVLRR